MTFATSSVEFSFDNVMYRQIDPVAMGSSLASVLSKFFCWFPSEETFATYSSSLCYFRYVDITLCNVDSDSDCDNCFVLLNNMYPPTL